HDEPTILMATMDLEHQNTPQLVARLVAESSRSLRNMQQRKQLPANYVTDVARVDVSDQAEGAEYLVTWVRLPADADLPSRIQTLSSGRHLDPPKIHTR
ncbi:MAG: hypothetical protein V2A76_12010, partial [Planctomycetota bacterium]